MDKITGPLFQKLTSSNLNKIFLGILVAAVILGGGTGYLLSGTKSTGSKIAEVTETAPKSADQDNRTFRDFAEGTIQKLPESKNPNEYREGTHLLVREGAVSVTLTSSVVDLNEYEGKKVKVLGETQKAIKSGWLMDVGRVEEKN